MGVILFGGAQYSLPEQANLTLIFYPKIVGERGGSPKIFFPTYPQNFFRTYIHTNILQNFPDIAKKIHVIFAKIQKYFYDISKIFRNLYVLPEFRSDFCPTVKILGGNVPPHALRPIRLCTTVQKSRASKKTLSSVKNYRKQYYILLIKTLMPYLY